MRFTRLFRSGACSAAAVVALGSCVVNNNSPTENTLPDPLAAGWQGNPVCEQLALNESQRVLKCTFEPGVGHERHYHPPHFGYALSGGRMRLNDAKGVREVDLATGSYFSSEGTPWHDVLNIGNTTVQYLIIEPRPNRAPVR